MALYVGTSGFMYPEWRGPRDAAGSPTGSGFYPGALSPARFLEHYARALSACELNTTFYGVPSERTVAGWAAATPERFRFAAKAHRRLTHTRQRIADDDWRAFLPAFLSSLGPLGPRLGPVLLQWPARRTRDDGMLDRVLRALPESARFAFEFRHESWDAEEVAGRLAEAGAVRCISETDGRVPVALPPGPVAYVRLRADRYGRRARAGWRKLLQREAGARDVYVFSKHKDVPPGNPFAGVGLAQWLERYCSRPPLRR